MSIKEKLEEVQENVSLLEHATFRIGGPARYFFVAKDKEDLKKAVLSAKDSGIPFLILGLGSNVLISDKGFDGLVIKNRTNYFNIENNLLKTESGVLLDRLAEETVKRGFSGLEKASGIPGTIGGAVFGNAGWFKGEWSLADVFKEAEILTEKGETERKEKEWFNFGYRDSKLKREKGIIVLEVVLKLKKGERENLEKKRAEFLKTRTGKIPLNYSAGCIFKNPSQKSAGFLIDSAGLKGKKIGQAQISEKHANFIINLGQAKAEDVKKLISFAKEKVKEKFGIELKEEIRMIGE